MVRIEQQAEVLVYSDRLYYITYDLLLRGKYAQEDWLYIHIRKRYES